MWFLKCFPVNDLVGSYQIVHQVFFELCYLLERECEQNLKDIVRSREVEFLVFVYRVCLILLTSSKINVSLINVSPLTPIVSVFSITVTLTYPYPIFSRTVLGFSLTVSRPVDLFSSL